MYSCDTAFYRAKFCSNRSECKLLLPDLVIPSEQNQNGNVMQLTAVVGLLSRAALNTLDLVLAVSVHRLGNKTFRGFFFA